MVIGLLVIVRNPENDFQLFNPRFPTHMKHTFKTNINCGGCIAKVTPFFEEESAIDAWKVDTDNPDKVLTVETKWDSGQVIALVEKAGFSAEPKKKGLLGRMFG